MTDNPPSMPAPDGNSDSRHPFLFNAGPGGMVNISEPLNITIRGAMIARIDNQAPTAENEDDADPMDREHPVMLVLADGSRVRLGPWVDLSEGLRVQPHAPGATANQINSAVHAVRRAEMRTAYVAALVEAADLAAESGHADLAAELRRRAADLAKEAETS